MADLTSPEVDKAELARKILSMEDAEEIKKALEGHDDLKAELMEDPDKFSEKYTAVTEPEKPAKETVDDDEIVELKIPKKMLGTYKTADDMLKGFKHKDEVIDILKQENEALQRNGQREVSSLREILKKHEQKPQEQSAPQAQEIDLEGLDTADLFEEGAQKKVLSTIRQLAESNKKLAEELNKVKGTVTNVSTVIEDGEKAVRQNEREAAEKAEFERIRKSSGIFESNRPVEQIESDYVNFLSNGSKLLGFDGAITDAAGVFTDGAKKAFQLYFDETAGAEFREKLLAANISFPEDYADIQRKTDLERIRNQYSNENTRMPWQDAIALYASRNGIQAKRELESRKQGAENFAKAVNNRKQFAKEVQPNEGSPSETKLDTETIGLMIREYGALKQTGKDVTQQRERLRSALLTGGMSVEEVTVYLDSFRGKE